VHSNVAKKIVTGTLALMMLAGPTRLVVAKPHRIDLDSSTVTMASMPLLYDVADVAPAKRNRSRLRIRLRGDDLELLDESGTVLTRQAFVGTPAIIINGSAADDTLVVDFSGGNPVPPGGLTFNGGEQATPEGDILEIHGGSFDTVVYDYFNPHDGRVTLDGAVINYTGLEPVTTSGTAANIIFNLPAGTVGASLQDDGTAGNGIVQLASTNATFELTTFTAPSTSLTVNAGGGTDTITTAASFSGDFKAKLVIAGTQATDSVTLNALTLGNAGANPGTLTVTANTISVTGVINTSGGTAGSVTFTAGTSIDVNSINAGSSYDVSLTAGGSASKVITSSSPNDGVADVTGRTVTLTANGPSNGNTGQIGFFNGSAQFFEVSATTINASTNNSRAWISAIGGAAIGSINAGTNTAFVRTVDGSLTSSHSGSTPDITAATVNFTSTGASGSFGTSSNPLLLQASSLSASVTGIGSINATNIAAGGNLTLTLAKTTNGAINLRAAGGNLTTTASVGTVDISAPGNTVTLTASGAIVSGTSAAITDVTAANLAASAGSGIGSSLVLKTNVSNLSFINSGGAVNIVNSGSLTIASVGGIASSTNNGTTTTLAATGSLTFAANTSSAGDLVATASETASSGDNLTVSSGVTVQSAAGNVTLNAGDNLSLLPGSTTKASGSVSFTIGFNDTDGQGGGTIQGTIMGSAPTVTGGPANDALIIDFASGASLPNGLTYDGGSGATNTLTITDQGSAIAHSYTLFDSSAIRSGTTVNFSNTQSVMATGGNASDSFTVTPSATTTFSVAGGSPAPPASPGDTLNVDTTGTTNPSLTAASNSSGFSGFYAFGNRKSIFFQQMESLFPPPPPSPTPTASPTATPTATPSGSATPGASPTPTGTPTPAPPTLGNVSTRLQVGTGNNVLFAGFIIQGSGSKTVLIRSIGPSLTGFGVPGAMSNPKLELHDASNLIGTNDDWQTTQLGGIITSDQVTAIQSSGLKPNDSAEPAIIATLPAGSYTAIVDGVGGAQGVATVELYDLSPNNGATLANISTRGFIQKGDNVMIGGFIIGGQSLKVIVIALGPSLIPFGINNALTNPQLELHDTNGTLAGNDNWQTTQLGGIITSDQSAEIQNSGLAPSNTAESAIIATLPPGNYTAIAQGAGTEIGVGVIQVFTLP
jgi:hypothetical protein